MTAPRPSHITDDRLADWSASRLSNDAQDAHKRMIWAHMRALADLNGHDHAAWFADTVAEVYEPRRPTFDHAAHNARVAELYGPGGWRDGMAKCVDLGAEKAAADVVHRLRCLLPG